MYDRRVVRGNTFAALVIPVSKYQTANACLNQYLRFELWQTCSPIQQA